MTALWIGIAVVALGVTVALAKPLMGKRQVHISRAEFDLNMFRDQLDEVERDIERGLLDETTGAAARIEIQRRILAADAEARGQQEGGQGKYAGKTQERLLAPALIAMSVPAAALAFYLHNGTPEAPNFPFAERDTSQQTAGGRATGDPHAKGGGSGAPTNGADMDALINRLVERLKETPDDITGWLLLGRSLASVQRYEAARNAMGRARQLAPGQPEVEIAYAEAVILASQMTITEEAAAILMAVHKQAPFEPKSRYYLGLQKAQNNDVAGAMQDWVDLLALSPRDAPWLPLVRNQMIQAANELNIDPAGVTASAHAQMLLEQKRAAGATNPSSPAQSAVRRQSPEQSSAPAASPGPTQDQMRAAGQMSAADRTDMIRGMVERLADRLKEEPNDLEGWQRLERAYRVLGDADKATEASAQIKRLSQ